MSVHNATVIVGNLTDAPELRFTGGGQAVANFTVAVNRRRKSNGEWVDELDGFFRCSCWRDMAENVAETLHKGDRVVVVGTLRQRTWEKDGQKRSAVEVEVDEVGPSLRWRTAELSKPARGGSKSDGGSKSWDNPAPVPEPTASDWAAPAEPAASGDWS